MTNNDLEPHRCEWVSADPLYIEYHDKEWGVPDYDSVALFEKLILDGAQAGLSWITILKKREGYRRAFDQFNPEKMAIYSDEKLEALMQNPEIVRNKLKIQSARKNARAFLDIEAKTSFSDFLWQFVGGSPIQNSWMSHSEIPTETAESQSNEQGIEKSGVYLCWSDDCLCVYASSGYGE